MKFLMRWIRKLLLAVWTPSLVLLVLLFRISRVQGQLHFTWQVDIMLGITGLWWLGVVYAQVVAIPMDTMRAHPERRRSDRWRH